MTQRIINIQINPNGSLRIDNSQNEDEEIILRELSELSSLLNGQPKGFKIEAHVHEHGHAHVHRTDMQGTHNHA